MAEFRKHEEPTDGAFTSIYLPKQTITVKRVPVDGRQDMVFTPFLAQAEQGGVIFNAQMGGDKAAFLADFVGKDTPLPIEGKKWQASWNRYDIYLPKAQQQGGGKKWGGSNWQPNRPQYLGKQLTKDEYCKVIGDVFDYFYNKVLLSVSTASRVPVPPGHVALPGENESGETSYQPVAVAIEAAEKLAAQYAIMIEKNVVQPPVGGAVAATVITDKKEELTTAEQQAPLPAPPRNAEEFFARLYATLAKDTHNNTQRLDQDTGTAYNKYIAKTTVLSPEEKRAALMLVYNASEIGRPWTGGGTKAQEEGEEKE